MSPKRTNAQRKAELARVSARAAHRGRCKRCGAETWNGLDAKVMALSAVVEVWAADAVEENLARLRSRWSYDVIPVGPVMELTRRHAGAVLTSPGRSWHSAGHVGLAHECDDPRNARRTDPPPPTLFDTPHDPDGPPPF